MSSTLQETVQSAFAAGAFVQEVEAASRAGVMLCLQCQKCTSGCPVAARIDIRPHEVVRLVQLGERDEVLSSRMIWECTSCETCATRCPQAVAIPALIDALRRLSRAAGKVTAATAVPAFDDVFLGSVREMGRVYELGLMAAFKLRTRNPLQDMEKFPAMMRRRKFALLPSFVRGRRDRARLFRRTQEAGGGKR